MSVIDMAKAHLQNVHIRIQELNKQKQLIDDEVNKLQAYITKGLEEIDELEESAEINNANTAESVK